jgi:hypothetical protein
METNAHQQRVPKQLDASGFDELSDLVLGQGTVQDRQFIDPTTQAANLGAYRCPAQLRRIRVPILVLRVLCVSVVFQIQRVEKQHGDAENTE